MKHMICILCGKKQDIEELYPQTYTSKAIDKRIFSARRMPDRIHYRIVRCTRCGLIFSDPVFPIDTIARFYKASVCTYDSVIAYTTETYLHLFDAVKNSLPSDPAILEVGCGNGFFLEAVRRRYGLRKLYGVEPGTDMVTQAPLWLRKNIISSVFKKNLYKKSMFDCIVCFHTLDHMPNPTFFVEEASRLLKVGGKIIIVVHDTDGLSVRLMGERSPIFDIEHMYLFNSRTLQTLCQRSGLLTTYCQPLVNTYPLWYWVRMSGLPYAIKFVVQYILQKRLFARLTLSLSGGNLAYIGIKE